MKLSRSRSGNESGQILVLTALMLAVLIGAVGLSIDIGFMMHTRTDLQKDADAMALAGARELCADNKVACEGNAYDKAVEWGDKNGVTSGEINSIDFGIDCDGGTSNPFVITVKVKRYQASFFARVLGFAGSDIGACATAGKFAIGSLAGIRPFAIDQNCMAEVGYESEVILKQDASSQGNTPCDRYSGNFNEMSIDTSSNSTKVYRDTILYGSTSSVCSLEVTGCTNYSFDTKTGNQPQALKDSVQWVLSNTPTNCDTWDEVVQGQGAAEIITPACNPWRSDYPGVSTRLWIIPIVNTLVVSGTKTVNIVAFATVFVQDLVCDSGNNCSLKARFIEASLSIPGDSRIPMGSGSGDKVTGIALIK